MEASIYIDSQFYKTIPFKRLDISKKTLDGYQSIPISSFVGRLSPKLQVLGGGKDPNNAGQVNINVKSVAGDEYFLKLTTDYKPGIKDMWNLKPTVFSPCLQLLLK